MTTRERVRASYTVRVTVHRRTDVASLLARPRHRRRMPDTTSPLVRLGRGCWIAGEQIADLVATCSAILDTSASDSVIVGFTAGRLHGLWLPDRSEPVHVATAAPQRAGRTMTRTRRIEFRAHRRELPRADRSATDGVPVTTIARTWRDLAQDLTLSDLVAAGDSALRKCVTDEALAAVVRRTAGLRGARRARAALALLDSRSRSRPESHLRVAIATPDLPRFEVNVPVYRSGGGWLGEPDLSLEEAKLGLEYQGEDHANKERMRRDLTRFKDFRGERWLMLPYGPAEVFKRPWEIRGEVRAEVATRAQHLIAKPRRPPRVVT